MKKFSYIYSNIIKKPSKHQQIAFYHTMDIGYGNFKNISEEYTSEPFSFLVSDITFLWDHPLAFRRIKSPRERTKNLIYILSEIIIENW